MEKTITCLLIDDDADDHEIFRLVLGQTLLPVECKFTDSCREAIKYVLAPHVIAPDFIFFDWYMPGIDGVDCLLTLKQYNKLDTSQCVIYSGSNQPEFFARLADEQNCKYLQKSGSIEELAVELKSLLEAKFAQKS